MATGQWFHIHVDNARGLDEEARDRLARSLIAELNDHEPGVASIGRAEAAGVKGGRMGDDGGGRDQPRRTRLVLGGSAVEHWLKRQDAETTLTLKGKNAEGKYFEVSVTGAAPGDVLEKLNSFIPQAK